MWQLPWTTRSAERDRLVGGRYRLGALLGAGATGQVFEAKADGDGLPVALKLLHADLASSGTMARRFRREARALLALDHPHIVKVLDVGRTAEGRSYLVMERLSGRSLADLLRRESLPIDRSVNIALDVLAAIGCAHSRGILHRDVKPGNIMLAAAQDGSEVVKVCDFGLAKLFRPPSDSAASDSTINSGLGGLCGTPEYMSPEQACGDAVDERTDLYSIGILLYELVTGTVPFRASSPMAVLSRHLTQSPEPPSARRRDGSIPPRLESLILRALAKDRASRPLSAEAFADELRTARGAGAAAQGLAGAAVDAEHMYARRTTAETLREPRPPRRFRPARLVSVGGIAGAVLLMVIVTGRWGQPAPQGPPPTVVPTSLPAPSVFSPRLFNQPPPAVHVAPPETWPSAPRQAKHRRTARVVTPPSVERAPGMQLGGSLEASSSAAIARTGEGLEDLLAEAERLLVEGKIAQACLVGEQAASRFPRQPAAHRFLARCLIRCGRNGEAQHHFQRYLELAPDADDAPFIREIIR